MACSSLCGAGYSSSFCRFSFVHSNLVPSPSSLVTTRPRQPSAQFRYSACGTRGGTKYTLPGPEPGIPPHLSSVAAPNDFISIRLSALTSSALQYSTITSFFLPCTQDVLVLSLYSMGASSSASPVLPSTICPKLVYSGCSWPIPCEIHQSLVHV